MESIIEIYIKEKIHLLVEDISLKYPNVDKDIIYHKINKLFPKKSNDLVQKIKETKPVIKVKKSKFSNYILIMPNGEHDHTFSELSSNNFVMNLTTKVVVGVENKRGEVLPLTKDLIDVCKKYKIRYEVPLNLNLEDNGEDDVIDNELKELGLNCAESGDDGSEEEN
jgi:hypothetical protein